MLVAFAVLLVIHGLIHGLGFLKAFDLALLPQLVLPISRPMGVVWLLAAAVFVATAGALFFAPRWWWLLGAVAAVLSQVAIISSWSDAKYGTLVNVIMIVAAVLGWFAYGPNSLRAEYDADVARGLARSTATSVVTEQDLAPLPLAVQRYLRLVGVVGQPRVHSFRVRWKGQIRGGPDKPWLNLVAEQHSFTDRPTRLFFMRASMFGLPIVGLHRYVGEAASMRVKVLSIFSMLDAKGPAFTRAETVTVFNDMCVLAPATLVDPAITWEEQGPLTVKASYRNAGMVIHAVLSFNEAGELTNFWSDDRPVLADGKLVAARWSTPLGNYRSFGRYRIFSTGEARYAPASGEYVYGRFEVIDIAFNGQN